MSEVYESFSEIYDRLSIYNLSVQYRKCRNLHSRLSLSKCPFSKVARQNFIFNFQNASKYNVQGSKSL